MRNTRTPSLQPEVFPPLSLSYIEYNRLICSPDTASMCAVPFLLKSSYKSSGMSPVSPKIMPMIKARLSDGKVEAPPQLAELRVLEIDTSKKDYVLVTLGDYSTAEIAWSRMGEDAEEAHQSLRRQLVHLAQAIATRLTPRATRWIATEYEKGGRVYAADPARVGGR